MNAIEMLKDDHKKVSALFSELESTTTRATSKRVQLVEEIERELSIHMRLEEEIFYPAFKEAGEKGDDDKMYFEALEEHRAAEEMVLPDLKSTDPKTEQFSGRAKVLKELIEHHVEEEEKEMFPRARKLFSPAQLSDLGASMARMKAELLPGPAPKGGGKGLIGSVLAAFASPAQVVQNNGSGRSASKSTNAKSADGAKASSSRKSAAAQPRARP